MLFSSTKRPPPSSLPSSSSKKPRFSLRNPSALAAESLSDDDNAPDAVLDADVIGSRGPVHKRNAVNIDGYDSDSDHDNFDRRAREKAQYEKAAAKAKAKSRLEEENDMFADLEDDLQAEGGGGVNNEQNDGGKKKKGVRFVNVKDMDIGEELSSKSGGHVSSTLHLDDSTSHRNQNGHSRPRSAAVSSSSDSEEEISDETRAAIPEDTDAELGAGSKKTHAPKLDAFNMRSEAETGAFDDQGNYIRKPADPDAVHDRWLEGLSKKDMKKAKEAAEKREEERRRKDIANDALSIPDVLKDLIPLLQRGETVLEALARLAPDKKKEGKRKPKWQTKQKNQSHASNGSTEDTQMSDPQPEDPAESKRRQAIESLTAAADLLLTKGQADIYDTERELLVRQYTRETGEEWTEQEASEKEDSSDRTWEYRWTDARDGGQANGPYDSSTMKQWHEAGYFGEGVEFRRSGEDTWSRVPEF